MVRRTQGVDDGRATHPDDGRPITPNYLDSEDRKFEPCRQ